MDGRQTDNEFVVVCELFLRKSSVRSRVRALSLSFITFIMMLFSVHVVVTLLSNGSLLPRFVSIKGFCVK